MAKEKPKIYKIDEQYVLRHDPSAETPQERIKVINKNHNRTGEAGLVIWRGTTQLLKGVYKVTRFTVRIAGMGVVNVGKLVLMFIKGMKQRSPKDVVRYRDGNVENNDPDNLFWQDKRTMGQENARKTNNKK